MIRFLTDTFIDEDTNLVAYEFSSEDADFPAENVLNRNRRSKVWRTALLVYSSAVIVAVSGVLPPSSEKTIVLDPDSISK